MEQSRSMSMGPGELSLTPGEQLIVSLLEKVHQRMDRMEQRMDRMEEQLNAHGKQLQALTVALEHESAASRDRDRQLEAGLRQPRKEGQEREVRLIARIDQLGEQLRQEHAERLGMVEMRLTMLEQTAQLSCEHIRDNGTALQELRKDVRTLMARLENPPHASA